jgi:hypothetical protein
METIESCRTSDLSEYENSFLKETDRVSFVSSSARQ